MEIDDAVRATDELMISVVESEVAVLTEASRHILTAGGKRVRPRLLFLSYSSAGGRDLSAVVPLAAAVELVHTATLVHDDINDHGRVRRGRETVNERWGRTFALLTGDYLFTRVYSLMAPFGDLNRILAEATVALVEGETLQAAAASDNNLNRETYQQIVAKKTASLFRAAALLGATCAGADSKLAEALGDYGFYLGLTFQIVDDLLDLTGDPRLMGKDAGIDIVQGKGVGSAYLQENLGNNGHGGSNSITPEATAMLADKIDEDPFLATKRRLIAGGAVEEGHQMARFLAGQAHKSLAEIPQSRYASELATLVDQVLNRES